MPTRSRRLNGAELLEGQSYECYLTNQLEAAAEARAKALALWRALSEGENVGRSLRWLSRLNWFLGDNTAAERYAADAIATLEPLSRGKELAMAYSNMSQLRMLQDDLHGAVHWGMQAIDLAEALGDDEILVHALNNVGAAQLEHGDREGRTRLEASLHLALAHDFEEHAARAYTNLSSGAVKHREYALATKNDFDEGIQYCTEHDLDIWRLYMTGWRAQVRLDLGDFEGASVVAGEVLASYHISLVIRIPALVVLAWVRLRRGDPGAQEALDEARDLALKTGEPQRIVPVATARAEAAWLRGDLARCKSEALAAHEMAERSGPWALGQICYWLWKAGELPEMPSQLPEPYALQFAGDWRSAATAWEQIGCPYEQALALAEGDATARRAALTILDRMGARATSARLKQQVIASRVPSVSRGPRSSTRTNPAGLTNQQLEVLRLMADGLRNAEIAEILSLSPKTVEHHVAAVLAKLNARSRAQAVSQAHTLGVLADLNHTEPQRP